jgi:hypothetical protein
MLNRGDIFGLRVRTADGQPTIRPKAVRCASPRFLRYLNFLSHGYDAHETCAPQRARIRNVAMPSWWKTTPNGQGFYFRRRSGFHGLTLLPEAHRRRATNEQPRKLGCGCEDCSGYSRRPAYGNTGATCSNPSSTRVGGKINQCPYAVPKLCGKMCPSC